METPEDKILKELEERAFQYRHLLSNYGLNPLPIKGKNQFFSGDLLIVCHSDAAINLEKNGLQAILIRISGDLKLSTSSENSQNGRFQCLNSCVFTIYSYLPQKIVKTGSFRNYQFKKKFGFIIKKKNIFTMERPDDYMILPLLS